MSADTIYNALKFAWDVIKDGKASVETSSSQANAVPQVDDWQALTNTSPSPNTKKMGYEVGYMWPLDDYDHVDFDILLHWTFGARYHGGGAFIPSVWIDVPNCFAGFPWGINIGMTAQPPANVGQPGAPMASLPVTIKGSVSSGAEVYLVEWGFVLFGDGSSMTTTQPT